MQTLFDGVTSEDNTTAGAALAGAFVSLVLYGVSVLQTYVKTIAWNFIISIRDYDRFIHFIRWALLWELLHSPSIYFRYHTDKTYLKLLVCCIFIWEYWSYEMSGGCDLSARHCP